MKDRGMPFFVFSFLAFFLPIMALGQNKMSLSPKPEIDGQTRMVLKVISEKYKRLGDWSAEFSQESFSPGLGKGSFALGNFVFSRPSSFVFRVNSKEKTEFFSNGKEAWYLVYPQQTPQAPQVKHFGRLESVELNQYLLLLKGVDAGDAQKLQKLLKLFRISSTLRDKNITLILEPRKPSEVVRVSLEFKSDQEAPERAEIEDALGGKLTIIVTSHKKLATKPNAEMFVPDLPKDSKIERL